MPTVDRIPVGLLSKRETTLVIVKFFEALAAKFPVLKASNGETKKMFPKSPIFVA
jgi:hypothetical protein